MLFILFTVSSFAQSYLIHNYTFYDGLPSSTVYDIAQDKNGVMWFTTRKGIAEYDGFEWKLHPATHHEVKDLRHVKTDRKGHVWIAGSNLSSGIGVYENKRWKHISVTDSTSETKISAFALAEIKDKTAVIIGTKNKGLLIYHDNNSQYLDTTNGLPDNHIKEIKVYNSQIYILTKKGLSCYFNGRIDKSVIPSGLFPDLDIQAFDLSEGAEVDTLPKIWLQGNDWLGFFENNSSYFFDTFQYYNYSIYIKAQILYDGHNGLYAGNVNGLFYYNFNDRSLSKLTRDNGFIMDVADAFCRDNENNIWIGAWQGVSKVVSQRFATYRKIHGLFRDEVTAFTEYQKGKYVFGHDDGLTIYDGKKYHRYENISGKFKISAFLNRTIDLCTDTNGNIWAAINSKGILKIDKSLNFKWYSFLEKQKISVAMSVTCDKDGKVWCSFGDKLYTIKNDKLVKISNFKLPDKAYIRKLFIDGTGGLFIATTNGGVLHYDGSSEKFFSPTKRNANNVFAIYVEQNKQVLCGTLDGLYKIDGDSLKKFKEGFEISHPVYFIIKDHSYNFWFGTDNGVYRWDGSVLKHFTHIHGLAGTETNRSAGYVDSQGKVWIGTDFGISKYDENKDNLIIGPELEITKITGDKINLFDLDNNTFSADQNNISIHFRCISFIDEKNISIEYKLEGIDKDWNKQKPLLKPEIRYSSLPPGEYRFLIRAQNVAGVKSPLIESPLFYISMPFYRQLWFYIFIAILITSFLFLFYLQYSRKKQADKLEALVEKRTSELLKSEQKLREFFEKSKDVIFISTADGKILDINPAGVDMFEYNSKEELLNLRIPADMFKNPADSASIFQSIKNKGDIEDQDIILKTKQGNELYMILSAIAVRDEFGELTEIRGILKNVTERKRLTEQLNHTKKMESIGVLAGGIAHDFNNILASIIGYTDMTIDDLPTDSIQYKNLKKVYNAGIRAKELVEQILTFSRQREHKVIPVRINKLTIEVLKLLETTIPTAIQLTSEIDSDCPMIMANPSQIHQAVMNLCTNAYQAIGENNGYIHVHIGTEKIGAKNHLDLPEKLYVKVSVEDSGKGIDQAVLNQIYDPFFTTKSVGKGTGLGLSVVHGIVNSFNGAIDVENRPGIGCTFTLYFPAASISKPDQQVPLDTIQSGSGNILLVDDDKAVADMSKQMLERLGYQVSVQYDSVKALKIFNKDPQYFDLVLSDQIMPNISGIELAQKILDIRPSTPIILMTGFSEKIDPEQIYKKGIKGYIEKPATKRELAALIKDII